MTCTFRRSGRSTVYPGDLVHLHWKIVNTSNRPIMRISLELRGKVFTHNCHERIYIISRTVFPTNSGNSGWERFLVPYVPASNIQSAIEVAFNIHCQAQLEILITDERLTKSLSLKQLEKAIWRNSSAK